jgi:hypothetical protein
MSATAAARETAYAAIDRAMAEAYEAGFRVAEQQQTDVVRADDVHQITDRLMIFQKLLGTSDPRYNHLGEIIGDLQRLLNPFADPRCENGLLPDGPTCPRCGKPRAPSGVDGGSWVHLP